MNRILSAAVAAALCACLFLAPRAAAQDGYTHSLELDASPGITLHTSPYFAGQNPLHYNFGSMIQGSLRWSISPSSGTPSYRLWPGLKMGIALKGLSLLKPSLTGSPVGLYVFQGADIARFSRRISLAYEWQFGATAPWQIMSSSHPDQVINGSPVCALLGASLLLRYNISSHWSIITGVDLAHYSNGNTRWPNSGTNTAALRIGIARRLGTSGNPPRLAATDTAAISSLPHRQRWHLDILAYGAWRKKCYHDADDKPLPFPGSFGVAGINFAPSYQLSRRVSVGPSVDFVFDESAVPSSCIIDSEPGHQPYYLRPRFMRQTALGVAAQADYSMPIFSLQVSMGYNVLAGCAELRYFYQTLSLRTFVTNRMWLNVGYSLRNFAHPRHLMLGIGVRIGGTRHPLSLVH